MEQAPTLLLLVRLVGYCSPPEAEQLSSQVVSLPFGLFASTTLFCHPLLQRGLRRLAAGPLDAELALGLFSSGVRLCPFRGLLDRLGRFSWLSRGFQLS